MIDGESRVVRDADLPFTVVDGEVIAMNAHHGNYYNLDVVGSFIWEMLETERTVSEICEHLQSRYNAPADIIRRDTIALLGEMRANKMIVVVDARSSIP